MQTQTPCSDYVETKGLIYFARMLDKIRLHAAGPIGAGLFCRGGRSNILRRALHQISGS